MSKKNDLSEHMVEMLSPKGGCQLIAIKVRRNQLCPCGSGKKAKNCCGAGTRYMTTKPKQSQE